MTLHGIDVSHYQSGLQIARTDAAFVIAKATEGTSYTDPTWRDWMTQAEHANRLRGLYHFAQGGGKAEADYFLDRIGGYLGEVVMALDWETNVSNVSGARAWLDRVHERTGLRPLIYMSQTVANGYDWSPVAAEYDLWVARYNDSIGSTGAWGGRIAMWQHTDAYSTGGYRVDGNRFYGTHADWTQRAQGAQPSPRPTPDDDTTDTAGVLPMSTLTTYRRRDDTAIPNDGKWHQLNLVNNDAEAQQFSAFTGPGPYYAAFNIQPAGGGVWAQCFLVDHKNGETAEEVSHELKVWIPQNGGQISSYGNLGQAKKSGWKRKLRVRVQATKPGVTINDIETRVGSV